MIVYELKFSYYDDDPENDDNIIIAVYSSYEKAETGRKKFLQQPRFKGKDDFLKIYEFKINEPWWDEGFWRATKSYFMIDLLNGYVIEKEHDSKIVFRKISGPLKKIKISKYLSVPDYNTRLWDLNQSDKSD